MNQQSIHDLIEPIIRSHGIELWACELHHTSRQALLRVLIDRDGKGVSLDDCAVVSREISAVLDVEDPIKTRYQLEVSSPGMDRALSTLPHFERYIGKDIKVKFRGPELGAKNGIMRIEKIIDNEIFLKTDTETMAVTLGDIYKANLVVT